MELYENNLFNIPATTTEFLQKVKFIQGPEM